MLAAIASAKACTTIERQFVPLHAANQPELATGVLWIRGCDSKNVGTRSAYELVGNGWSKDVKFAVHATIHADGSTPDFAITSVGGSTIDKQALQASVASALATVDGDSRHLPIALRMGVPMVFGSELAPNGMTVNVDASGGPVSVALVCRDWAEASAEMFEVGRPLKGSVPVLAQATIQDHGQLSIKGATCPVVVIARSSVANTTATLDWQRPSDKILSMR